MKEKIRISYNVHLYFRHNILIVYGGNGFKHVIRENMELRGYGLSMKVKADTHHVRVKMTELKEYRKTTDRCLFEDKRPTIIKLRF